MSKGIERVWLWLAVIGGVAAIAAVLSAAAFDADEFDWDGWAFTILIGGVLMLAGVYVRQRVNRVSGDWLVAVGSIGLGLMFWWILPTLVAIFLIVFGIKDAVQADRAAV